MNIEQVSARRLIEQCSDTIRKFEEIYKQTGQKYNIFKVTDIYTDEVKICKVLTDLLNPNGNHYKGDCFLKCFIKTINKKMPSPLRIDTGNAHVKKEYSTDKNRRIDIVIEDRNIFIPIEVKIHAGDQKNQIPHYADFSRFKNKNKNKNVPVIYLTIEGNSPSNASEGEFVPISYKHDILEWLNNCLRDPDVEKAKPVYEVLKQLIASIKLFCGISEDEEMEKEIESLISQSEDSLRAAIAIKQAVESFDQRVRDLFSTKILERLQKCFPEAKWSEGGGWNYIYLPVKDGKYILYINYNWRKMGIEIKTKKNVNLNEKNALHKKMSELTGITGENRKNYAWYSVKFSYPNFPDSFNIDNDLYSYKLYKEYSKNSAKVVNSIVNIINDINNINKPLYHRMPD